MYQMSMMIGLRLLMLVRVFSLSFLMYPLLLLLHLLQDVMMMMMTYDVLVVVVVVVVAVAF